MAVVVDSVSPADATTGVYPDTPVIVELSDSTDMTLSLIEVVVNGESCTTTNGWLDAWSIQTVSGGVYVADYTSVVVGTTKNWHQTSGETVTVTVKYNSSTISTTTFDVDEITGVSGGSVGYETFYTRVPSPAAVAAHFVVFNRGVDRISAGAYYWTTPTLELRGGVHYRVAVPVTTEVQGSAVVGVRADTEVPASAVVQAYTIHDVGSSVVVQGYFRGDVPASVITGVVFQYETQASAVVGIKVLDSLPASAVVYGVIQGTNIHIRVYDPSTKSALEALGVVFV